MRAAEVKLATETVASGHAPTGGASAMAFILPMIVCLGSALFLTSAFVALSPTGSGLRQPADGDADHNQDQDKDQDQDQDQDPVIVARGRGLHA
jgi:hypothetical protein